MNKGNTDMTTADITKELKTLRKRIAQLETALQVSQDRDAEQACAAGKLVVAYVMSTGTKYCFGKKSFMLSHKNRYGEYDIRKGKTVVAKHPSKPIQKISELLGADAYKAYKIKM